MATFLGTKIRVFRKRAGISQMDLEVATDSATGSMSRIESGEVNPTKETLLKIALFLKLTDFEIAELFSFQLETPTKLLETVNLLATSKNVDEVVKTIIDSLYQEFRIHAGIFMKDTNHLIGKYNGTHGLATNAIGVMGFPSFNDIRVSINEFPENLLVKSFKEVKVIQDTDINKFGIGIARPTILNLVKKLIDLKACIAIPLIATGEKEPYGIFVVVVTSDINYSNLLPLLKSIATNIAENIRRSLLTL